MKFGVLHLMQLVRITEVFFSSSVCAGKFREEVWQAGRTHPSRTYCWLPGQSCCEYHVNAAEHQPCFFSDDTDEFDAYLKTCLQLHPPSKRSYQPCNWPQYLFKGQYRCQSKVSLLTLSAGLSVILICRVLLRRILFTLAWPTQWRDLPG